MYGYSSDNTASASGFETSLTASIMVGDRIADANIE